jgi:hypothetical protein
MADDDLVIKNLREKCVNNNVRKITRNIENLGEMCTTMDIWYKRFEKYIHSGGFKADN